MVALVLATVATHAQTYTVLYSFMGPPDGANPQGVLTLDAKGDLYGATENGGTGGCSEGYKHFGCGTVFKLDTTGKETVLYGFPRKFGQNGEFPGAGVVRDPATGILYGATSGGGDNRYGVVFKVEPNGKQTVLYSFKGGPDGAYPSAVVRDPAGNLYGTTSSGGGTGCGGYGCGTVFRLTASGKESLLHRFAGSDGAFPFAGLIRDAQGNLYGTTWGGGSSQGFGTVFMVNKFGTEIVRYNFTGGTDGANPSAGLLLDNAGDLYGTTLHGGTLDYGTVFKLNKFGKERVLHSFAGPDGAHPAGGVVRDSAGNLYGATHGGGSTMNGTVFKIDTLGGETVLYSFKGYPSDGAGPKGLVRDAAGNLYGTTDFRGGNVCSEGRSGCGTIFKITP